jgi:Bacterial Ig-like domain (group 3)/Right handed beta helix region
MPAVVSRGRRRAAVVVVGTVLAAFGVGEGVAFAATTYFASPAGTGTTCSSAVPCSLATAVGKTVAGDTVKLAGGTYAATAITASHSIVLSGDADTPSVLDGGNSTTGAVITDTGGLTVDNVVIENGNIGIDVAAAITLNLLDTTVEGNSGDGIRQEQGPIYGGNISVSDSTISDNGFDGLDVLVGSGSSFSSELVTFGDSTVSDNGAAGIAYAPANPDLLAMSLSGTTIDGNGGAGLDDESAKPFSPSIDNSTFSGNSEGIDADGAGTFGGSISNSSISSNVDEGLISVGSGQFDPTLSGDTVEDNRLDGLTLDGSGEFDPSVKKSVISGNGGSGFAAGEGATGTFDPSVTSSTISSNSGAGFATQVQPVGSGTFLFAPTVSGSTIDDNEAGFLDAYFLETTSNTETGTFAPVISDSTITGNLSGITDGASVAEFGTAPTTHTFAPVVTASTIADNVLGGLDDIGNTAGGTDVLAPTLGADIVAGNGIDCDSIPIGTVVDRGYDIDGDGSCRLIGPGSVSHSTTIAASLELLADNGGPTQTIAMAPGSPARGLVGGTLTGGVAVCGTKDQRGQQRTAPTCDAGAFEATTSNVTPNVTLAVSPPGGTTVGNTVSLIATVSGPAGAPTGTVAFKENGSSVTGCSSIALATVGGQQQATCTVGVFSAGSLALTAIYSGSPGSNATYGTGTGTIASYDVAAVTPGVTLSVQPEGGAGLGQAVTLTTALSGSDTTPTGTVDFTANGASVGCDSASISSGGIATCTTTSLGAGTYDLRARYGGDTNNGAGVDDVSSYVIAKGATTTAISVSGSSLTATVAPVAPATGTPSGTVTFSVDGVQVGTASLSGGTATLNRGLSGAHAVAATYRGDGSFEPSDDSTATTDPTITAAVTSAVPKTSFGWYRAPVTVSFTCAAGTGTLTGACPSPVTVSTNGAGQVVTKTITASDGGVAMVTVAPINIDQAKPTVKVTGVQSGHTYRKAPKAKCVGTDALSGLATCALTVHSVKKGKTQTVTYQATATDRAGNTATVKGTYTVKP